MMKASKATTLLLILLVFALIQEAGVRFAATLVASLQEVPQWPMASDYVASLAGM